MARLVSADSGHHTGEGRPGNGRCIPDGRSHDTKDKYVTVRGRHRGRRVSVRRREKGKHLCVAEVRSPTATTSSQWTGRGSVRSNSRRPSSKHLLANSFNSSTLVLAPGPCRRLGSQVGPFRGSFGWFSFWPRETSFSEIVKIVGQNNSMSSVWCVKCRNFTCWLPNRRISVPARWSWCQVKPCKSMKVSLCDTRIGDGEGMGDRRGPLGTK